MKLYEMLGAVWMILVYIMFGLVCLYVGYKKGFLNGKKKGYVEGGSFICNRIREIIKSPETEEDTFSQTVTWISSEERPPKKAGRYIVHIKGFAYATDLQYDDRDGFYDEYDDGERVYYNVMHWAEFPELPEGEVQKEVAK